MDPHPVILCPVDFSDASRLALRFASAIAEGAGARLLILTVDDPLFVEEVELGTGIPWNPEESRRRLGRFAERILGDTFGRLQPECAVRVGMPAPEILRVAQEQPCALIVMSTRGATGMRKLFFGATTERVLRETVVPVLLTPPDGAPADEESLRAVIRRVLVPVDLKSSSMELVNIARLIAEAAGVPFLLTHVVEPGRHPVHSQLHGPSVELERRVRAEDALHELLATVPRRLHPEAILAYGDPAEEIVKIAHTRNAGLIVIGLQGSPALAPRMGSVTYRVLCLGQTLVLAVPPQGVRASAEPLTAAFVRGQVH